MVQQIFDPTMLITSRGEVHTPGWTYSIKSGHAPFGIDVLFPDACEADERRMSLRIPFADGNHRDGVGDLLEVGGIQTERHRANPVVLFDHGKQVTLPIAMAEDPDSKEYTVSLDPMTKVATLNAFFYQGKGLNGVEKSQEYDHALFCHQLFDLAVKRYVRAGSIGYQVVKALQLQPDYERGTPQGLHLLVVLMLEGSLVVMPANMDTVRKSYEGPTAREILCLDRVCGKPLSPMLVKSLTPHVPDGQPTTVGFGDVKQKELPKKIKGADSEHKVNDRVFVQLMGDNEDWYAPATVRAVNHHHVENTYVPGLSHHEAHDDVPEVSNRGTENYHSYDVEFDDPQPPGYPNGPERTHASVHSGWVHPWTYARELMQHRGPRQVRHPAPHDPVLQTHRHLTSETHRAQQGQTGQHSLKSRKNMQNDPNLHPGQLVRSDTYPPEGDEPDVVEVIGTNPHLRGVGVRRSSGRRYVEWDTDLTPVARPKKKSVNYGGKSIHYRVKANAEAEHEIGSNVYFGEYWNPGKVVGRGIVEEFDPVEIERTESKYPKVTTTDKLVKEPRERVWAYLVHSPYMGTRNGRQWVHQNEVRPVNELTTYKRNILLGDQSFNERKVRRNFENYEATAKRGQEQAQLENKRRKQKENLDRYERMERYNQGNEDVKSLTVNYGRKALNNRWGSHRLAGKRKQGGWYVEARAGDGRYGRVAEASLRAPAKNMRHDPNLHPGQHVQGSVEPSELSARVVEVGNNLPGHGQWVDVQDDDGTHNTVWAEDIAPRRVSKNKSVNYGGKSTVALKEEVEKRGGKVGLKKEKAVDKSGKPTGGRSRSLGSCECDDPGCPVHQGGSSCNNPATQNLRRIDMEDETGTPMCEGCADDAFESGLFKSIKAQGPKNGLGTDNPAERGRSYREKDRQRIQKIRRGEMTVGEYTDRGVDEAFAGIRHPPLGPQKTLEPKNGSETITPAARARSARRRHRQGHNPEGWAFAPGGEEIAETVNPDESACLNCGWAGTVPLGTNHCPSCGSI